MQNSPHRSYKVLHDVTIERAKQDERWGPVPRLLSDEYTLAILAEEFGEVARLVVSPEVTARLREELIQVAAVAVWWVEELDAESDAGGGS